MQHKYIASILLLHIFYILIILVITQISSQNITNPSSFSPSNPCINCEESFDELSFKHNLFRETFSCIIRYEKRGISNTLLSFAKENINKGDDLSIADLNSYSPFPNDNMIFESCRRIGYHNAVFPNDKVYPYIDFNYENQNQEPLEPLIGNNRRFFNMAKHRPR